MLTQSVRRTLLLACAIMAVSCLLVRAEEESTEKKAEKDEIQYKTPRPSGPAYFAETFDNKQLFEIRWVKSSAKKDDVDDNIAKYDGIWSVEPATTKPLEGDLGLVLKSEAKHHAIAAKLDQPIAFDGKPVIIQYEVKFQKTHTCGGAYVKLLSESSNFDLSAFHDKTPYTIMFGPDKCGPTSKLHFIFRHRHPVLGTYEEKHAKKASKDIDFIFTDGKWHLLTLVVQPDNSYDILVDNESVNKGNLLEDFEPSVNPPKEIDDPDDKKPEDWDDREKVPDPDATKPDDWDESEPQQIADASAKKPEGWLDDEPELIPDPNAKKPVDWDDEMDGEWEAPMVDNPRCSSAPGCGPWKAAVVDNPKYKGKWRAPMISNPNYQGIWKPQRIANPNYFEDLQPYKMTPIAAIGFELWSMTADILFDNIILTSEQEVAADFAQRTFLLKKQLEKGRGSGDSVIQALLDATNEHPWLWALIAVVLILPLVIIITLCCSKSDKTPKKDAKKEEKENAQTKEEADSSKADAAEPDDAAAAAEESDESAGEEQEQSSTLRKRAKPRVD